MHCPNNALHQLLELIIIDYSRMCITARDVTRPQSFQQLSNMRLVFVSSEAKNRLEPQFCPGNRSLVLVPTEKNHSCSTVHSRAREYDGRLPVEAPKRQDGLGVRTHHFQLCEHSVGPASGGCFCNTFFKATSPFLQLATGPQTRGHRCFFTELDQYPRLCTSFFVPNFTSPSESSSRPSNSGTHHPIIAHAVMVPSLNEPPGRLSTPPAKDGRGNKAISELQLPNTGVTSSTGRLEGLRQRFRAEKISDQAIELILSSWRDKTTTQCGKLGSPGVQQEVFIPFRQVYPMF